MSEEFNKNWPFREDLAEALFMHSRHCDSLKQYLSDTAFYDSENEGDNETDSIYDLSFSEFYIEKDTL